MNRTVTLACSATGALNPVALFIGLAFWFYICGIPGAFIAVPLLATLKIFCDHTESLASLGEFLGQRDARRRDFVIALAQLRATAVLDFACVRWEVAARIDTSAAPSDARGEAGLARSPDTGTPAEGATDSGAARRAIWSGLEQLLVVLVPEPERAALQARLDTAT